jgi:hypothetical protein
MFKPGIFCLFGSSCPEEWDVEDIKKYYARLEEQFE